MTRTKATRTKATRLRAALGRPHRLGHGFAVMYKPEIQVEHEGLDLDLQFDVDDGRLVVTSLCARQRAGGPPVTIDFLKSLPLVRFATTSVLGDLGGLVQIESRGPRDHTVSSADVDDLSALSEVERAAVVYRAAYFFGLPPTAKVAEVLGVSHAVAAKRVQAGRRAGLLEPTTKGKKGA